MLYISCAAKNCILEYNWTTKKYIRSFDIKLSYPTSIAISPDKKSLFYGTATNGVGRISLATGKDKAAVRSG